MTERQKKILEIITKEYQKTGQPVASQVLVKKYNLDLSPATLRAEMSILDREGLLIQPHTSAGRLPTTKAYRLFVDQLLKEQGQGARNEEKIKKSLRQLNKERIFSRELAQILADFSHNLGLSGSFGKDADLHEAGFSSLLEDPELCQPESVAGILRGFDIMEKEFFDLFHRLEKEVEVFIGDENPISDLKECSLLISNYRMRRQEGFIGILGPKRMNYDRNVFLIKQVKNILEENTNKI